jgi:hypothetical protein
LIFRDGFALFALAGFGAFLLKARASWHDPYFHLIVLAAVFMAARILAFPNDLYRSLLAPYLMLTLGLIQACASLDARLSTSSCRSTGSNTCV